MQIFIELPSWLGDTIMTTPAIENILKIYPKAELTLFGSHISIQALRKHPQVKRVIVDESKKAKCRICWIYKIAKSLGEFDKSFTFRKRVYPKFLQFFLNSKEKYIYKRYTKKPRHQVLRYNDFINHSLKVDLKASDLKLYHKKKIFKRPTLGLNPGATYGSAKRWYPDRFAKVATALHKEYDIIIFGGVNEIEMAKKIEENLIKDGVLNFQNLAGKTTVDELIEYIAGLSLFITNDSGPMHIASAFKIPTIALFGPTKWYETSPWKNPNAKVVKKDLECMPCMKRTCPLKTHECMKRIEVKDVLDEVNLAKKDYLNQNLSINL